ncbi:MobP2 family relaxase [Ligilactobacillus murinus]|nr:MobP2 family relaxase [Ligilactobacillus murinus]
MSKSPAVTVMWDYTTPYAKFVDYTKRKEAVVVKDPSDDRLVEGIDQATAQEIAKEIQEQTLDYVGYIDYMKRNYATKNDSKEFTGIFTDKTLNASTEEAEHLKDMLVEAKENKSLLWRGVISFDNDFLARNGVYIPKSKEVDQEMIKKVVRKAMVNVIKREKLSDSAFWWGNIHLNTDNIHVHVGLSEIKSARPTFFYAARNRRERKGKFSQKTIKGIKSNVYNSLTREDKRSIRLDKEKKIASLRDKLLKSMADKEADKLERMDRFFVDQVIDHLPKGKKLRYGSNAKDFRLSKFFIDRYVDHQLQNNMLVYKNYQAVTESLLDDYRYAYDSGGKEEKNSIYREVTKIYGREVARTLRTKESSQFMNKRMADLRKRLGDRALKYIQEIAKKRSKSNIEDLSAANQKLVKEQDRNATMVHSEEIWTKMGYKIAKDALPIVLVVPIPDDEKDSKHKSKREQKNGKSTPKGFEKVEFYDERFVEPINPDKVRLDIDIKSLKSMKKEDLLDLVELAQAVSKEDPENRRSKQEVGVFKFALRQRILEERKHEIDASLELLNRYENPVVADATFLDYKKMQFSDMKNLVELQLMPKYKLSKKDLQQKEDLEFKYVDAVQVSISKVDQKMADQQREMLMHEIKLAKNVQDPSIFELLKGKGATKKAYVNELAIKYEIIDIKRSINLNNQTIKQTKDEVTQKELRKRNGMAFEQLKELYSELSSDESRIAKIQLEWDYQHDHSFRRQISRRIDQQRSGARRTSYNRVSHSLVKGLSMALRDDSSKRERLLRQLEQEERREKEKER